MLIRQLDGVDCRLMLLAPDGTQFLLPFDPPLHPLWLELAVYLGKQFRPEWCTAKDTLVQEERQRYPSAEAFYRDSDIYLYHLIGYWLEGFKRPAHAWLLSSTGNMRTSVLDYGCGIGCDGIWLLDAGYEVSFADMPGKSLDFLRWRLAQRMYLKPRVYELPLPGAMPPHDIVWCTDVIEHLPPEEHEAFIEYLATLGNFVIMNLVDDKHTDGQVHFPVDVGELTVFIQRRWSAGYAGHKDYYLQNDGSKVRIVTFGTGLSL